MQIQDVQKSLGNIFVHKGTVIKGLINAGGEVKAEVDSNLRQRAEVHFFSFTYDNSFNIKDLIVFASLLGSSHNHTSTPICTEESSWPRDLSSRIFGGV